ncbi:hypothetical protein E1A91_A01G149000v1 [Gossypium mustelinum]|uniref:Uncharacterized protein n=1 Tax=Gossypium mustelinum TaxID=34275 RepID=A0A5D3AD91_GOSMU|nr:hypothetical protein E1A91_A01G149000v1 [Gossypium mustelinum]
MTIGTHRRRKIVYALQTLGAVFDVRTSPLYTFR